MSALDIVSAAWASAMARACWQGGAAILVAWAVDRALPRLAPRVRCWLWRLVFLKLLAALLWAAPVPLPLLPAGGQVGMGKWESGRVGEGLRRPQASRSRAVRILRPPDHPTSQLSSSQISARRAHPFPHSPIPQLLFTLWLAGLVAGVARMARAGRRTARLVRASRPLEDERLVAAAERLGQALGLRQLSTLLISAEATRPFAAGLVHPAVVLPASLLDDCSAEEVRMVVAHELAHLARRDLLWNWLPLIASFLLFFHPLVWVARRLWHGAQEMACDELVLEASGAETGDYAALLVKVATWPATGVGHSLLAVGVIGPYRVLERRLRSMERVRTSSPRRSAAAGATLFLLGLVAIVPWRVVAQPESAASSAAAAPPEIARPSEPRATGMGAAPASAAPETPPPAPSPAADPRPTQPSPEREPPAPVDARADAPSDASPPRVAAPPPAASPGEDAARKAEIAGAEAQLARAQAALNRAQVNLYARDSGAEAARAAAAAAASRFERAQKLVSMGLLAQVEVDDAQANLARSQASLAQAQAEVKSQAAELDAARADVEFAKANLEFVRANGSAGARRAPPPPLRPLRPDPANEKPDDARPPVASPVDRGKLAASRLAAGREAWNDAITGFGEGAPGMEIDTVYQWSRRLLDAQRAVGTSPAAQVTAFTDHLKRMQALEQLAQRRFEAGLTGRGVMSAATYFRAEAELWLSDAKAGKAPAR